MNIALKKHNSVNWPEGKGSEKYGYPEVKENSEHEAKEKVDEESEECVRKKQVETVDEESVRV